MHLRKHHPLPGNSRPDRPQRRWTGALLLLSFLLTVWASSAAASQTSQSALVIDYGNGTMTYAVVPFSEATISGFELLQQSGLSLVSIPFGGLGEGICSIESHGCGVGECRRLCQTSDPESPFWHYYVLHDGVWELQPRGASGTEVRSGEIHGWSWTGAEPGLPFVTFDEIVTRAAFSASADQAAFRTFDSSGSLVAGERDEPPWTGYAAALAIVAFAAIVLLIVVRRRAPKKAWPE